MTKSEKYQVEQTYEREKGRLLGFIRNRIPDEMEAEDLMQDVFLRLIMNTTGISTIENITAWIYSVTRNRIVDFFRKKKTDSLEDQLVISSSSEDPLSLSDILPSSGENPEETMMSELIWEEIEDALDEMPPEQREVFVYHELEDLSFKQIAELTGVNQNTLLARKRYAILFLRTRLQELYNQIKE
jgi:RNA polymerase sigma factor (sigma-70 family)